MPLQETSGTASYDAFGGGAPVAAKYIEQYFSTWLRTGTGASATITTGLDASANKALVWTKSRSAATDHKLTDTVRGATKALISDTTGAQTTDTNGLTAFSSTGYTIGSDTNYNNSGATYVDWEFVATPKFFDLVTYTGNGANRTIAHNLGSIPGCIIVKRTDTAADWQVYHRSLANTEYLVLNTAAAKATGTTRWNSTTPTSTVFSIGTDTTVNANGGTYVAYLFAHDAGGFGLSGADNVISCGSFTNNTNTAITLGWEPQWILLKDTENANQWQIYDTLRGNSLSASSALLPAASAAETSYPSSYYPTATGFVCTNNVGSTGANMIYIAIRRGPMKTPTSGTSVFAPVKQAGGGTVTTNFPVDLALNTKPTSAFSRYSVDRLRGSSQTTFPYLTTESTDAEVAGSGYGFGFDNNTGYKDNGVYGGIETPIYWNFRRAPGFFDEACYTGTGANRTVTHNLGVVPELMIVKRRDTTGDWWVYDAATGNTKYQVLNSTATPVTSATAWNNTTPTSSVFTVGTGTPVNASGGTYVAYLFASCPGVSKVTNFTGNGSTQTINCGFTTGARFVLIKATSTTGNWLVFDTARGMTTSTDPWLALNSTAAESATTGACTTTSVGFTVDESKLTGVNTNGVSYIALAVA